MCAIIGEKLRMEGNVGVQEVVSMREVFLYVCWGANWSVELMGYCHIKGEQRLCLACARYEV